MGEAYRGQMGSATVDLVWELALWKSRIFEKTESHHDLYCRNLEETEVRDHVLGDLEREWNI